MSFSRIGLHVLANGVKAEALATAPVLCLVDCSTEYIREVRQHNPSAWIVVRWVFQGDQNAALREPEKAAEAWFAEHKAAILATNGPRTVYQGLNEIGSGLSDLYLRYERHRAGLLWSEGVGFGLGAWSVGEPDWYVWAIFATLVDRMDAGDAILLHEYIADVSDLEKRWYTARWADERVAPIVAGHNIIVTEWGRDVLYENNVKRGQAGWRGAVNAEAFLMETARYNDLLCQSPDVIGACGFTAGRLDNWGAFDWNQLWPRIVAGHGAQVEPEPLPENETARDPETMAEKSRWFIEEVIRRLELAGEPPESYAMRVLYGLVNQRDGLLYRLERTLKGHADVWRPPESER